MVAMSGAGGDVGGAGGDRRWGWVFVDALLDQAEARGAGSLVRWIRTRTDAGRETARSWRRGGAGRWRYGRVC
jgi:hypothetical protein